MDSLILALIDWGLLVCVLEGIMWILFRRKALRICFPGTVRELPHCTFTIAWLRAMAVAHTALMITVLFLVHLLLW